MEFGLFISQGFFKVQLSEVRHRTCLKSEFGSMQLNLDLEKEKPQDSNSKNL